MAEWQPRDTAPKDGTIILVCIDYDISQTVRWISDTKGGYWEGRFGNYDDEDIIVWQPLPKPPKEKHNCVGWNEHFRVEETKSGLFLWHMDQWTYIKYCPFCGEKA